MSTLTSTVSKAGTKSTYINKKENYQNDKKDEDSYSVVPRLNTSSVPTLTGSLKKESGSSGMGLTAQMEYEQQHKEQTQKKTDRGVMDRIFGVLGYNGVVEGLYNLVDDDEDSNFFTGLGEGLKYMNPFTDDVSERHSFSDVLEKLGWENDDGVSASDVGRGVLGFVGDVLLDPITYFNPYSSISKVVKGTGKAADVAGTLSKIAKADDVSKAVRAASGAVNAENLRHLKDLDYKTAYNILESSGSLAEYAPDDIPKVVNNFVDEFNTKVKRYANGGEDLTVGLNHLPFSSKINIGGRRLDSFKKTLMTSDELRQLGDNTIAPYYNALARKLRTSRLGQRFSQYNQLEATAMNSVEDAAKLFHVKELDKAWRRLSADLPHLRNAQKIEEYMNGLENDKLKDGFRDSIETGELQNVLRTKRELAEMQVRLGANDKQEAVDRMTDIINALDEFKQESGYNDLMYVKDTLKGMGYAPLPPMFEEIDDSLKYARTMDQLSKHTNRDLKNFYSTLEDEKVWDNLDEHGKEVFKRFSATLKSLTDDTNQFVRKNGLFKNGEEPLNQPDIINIHPAIVDKAYGAYDWKLKQYRANPDRFNHYVQTTPYEAIKNVQKNKRDKIFGNIGKTLTGEFTGESVGVHEFGHVLFHECLSPVGQKKIINLFNRTKKPTIMKKISGYGATDVNEFVAEAIASLRAGGNAKVAQSVRKIIREDTGIKIEEWAGLKLFEDKKEWNDALDAFESYVKYNNIPDVKWYDDIEDIYGKALKVKYNKNFKELKQLTKDIEKLDSYTEKYGEEGLDIGKLWIDSMNSAAQKEIERGFLKREQWEALKGKYILHLKNEDLTALENMLKENPTGHFDPDIYGKLRGYGQRRSSSYKTISEINRAAKKVGISDNLLETSLSKLYLARMLGSNKLLYGSDVQKFIKNNFFKQYKPNGRLLQNYSPAISYADVQIGLRRFAAESAAKSPENEKANVLYEKYINELFDLGDKNFKVTFSPNNPIQVLNEKQCKYLVDHKTYISQVNNEVINQVNSVTRMQKMQMQSNLENIYERFVTLWKLNNTIVHPGFHIQNVVSNAFQSFLGIGEDAFDVKQIRKAYKIFKNPDPKQTIKIGDKVWNYKELNYAAQEAGIVDKMFHTYEYSKGLGQGGFITRRFPTLDPTNMENFFAYDWGTKIGTTIEGTQRMNLFISALKQTDNDIKKATEMVNKFLFDYSELTDFEQKTMKKIIPFYTFMRKNLPLELEQMLDKPQFFSGLQKAVTNFEKIGDEYYGENDRNEWRQEHIQLPFKLGGKTYGVGDQLPYNQIERAIDPKKILGQTTPFIKVPYELATGQYAYTGMDVDGTGGYMANQTFFTKMINVARNIEDPVQRRAYVVGQLIGFPIGKIEN